MPTITVPDDTYERIASRAAVLGTTVEALVVPALEQLVLAPQTNGRPTEVPGQLPYDEWKANFDDLLAQIYSRAERYTYPPGFEVDASREAMYEGCGE